MRIIARSTLKLFWIKYTDAEQPLKSWFEIVKASIWEKPNDIKEVFRSADILSNSRVVFNIKGNKYRLIVSVRYDLKIVYVRFIGTHAEYDKINVKEI